MPSRLLDNTTGLEKLQHKFGLLEDHDRRNNISITGITRGRVTTLLYSSGNASQMDTPTWHQKKIERARRIYSLHLKENISTDHNPVPAQTWRSQRYRLLNGACEVAENDLIQDAGKPCICMLSTVLIQAFQ